MMKTATLFLALLAISCGGQAPSNPIVGSWGISLDNGCVDVFTFSSEGKYVVVVGCDLQGGGFGAMVETGTYAIRAAQVTFMPLQDSCAPADRLPEYSKSDTVDYDIIGDKLTLINMNFAVTLQHLDTSSPSTSIVEFGCWIEDNGDPFGVFHTAPLSPL